MFTYIKLKNFMSFGDTVFDFRKSEKNPKNFIAIYGENGCGKSNFVNSISLLSEMLRSFSKARHSEEISQLLEEGKEDLPNDFVELLMRQGNIQYVLERCRMVECDEPTEIEYGFVLHGVEGFYRITFSQKLCSESLYCFTGKQRGYLFDIHSDGDDVIFEKYHGSLFRQEKSKKEFTEEVKKYWGKHSFLSIVVHQMEEKNRNYIKESISSELLDVLELFQNISVVSKQSNRQNSSILSRKPATVLVDLRSGRIPEKMMPMLKRSERIIREFFTQSYADIKDVWYETNTAKNGSIRYQLFVEKMIAGHARKISFENESAGTQQVLEIVRTLLGLFCGVTVVYDEIDNGIHDVLLTQILTSLSDEITGQLIFTTHNTMLMEEVDPHNVYVIQVDYRGDKKVRCAADYGLRSTNNMRTKYLKGMFGGTPYIDGIDYDAITQEILTE